MIDRGQTSEFSLVLLDGSELTLTLPRSLASDVKSFVPAGAVGWDFGTCCGRTIEIAHGSVQESYGDRTPDAVYRDGGGGPVNFYVDPGGVDHLVFQFGSWVVSAWDDGPGPGERFTDDERRLFASRLSGHETPEGFLVLDPVAPMELMHADAPDGRLTTNVTVNIFFDRPCPDSEGVTASGLLVTVSEEAGQTSLCAPDDAVAVSVSRVDLTPGELDAVGFKRQAALAAPLEDGPDSRPGFSSVWTGRELIVWGGHAPSDVARTRADGAAYDPTAERWRAIAPAPIRGMTWHFAAWTGSEMLVVGTSGTAAYDPAGDSWRELAPSPVPIEQFRSALAWSGSHAYVWNPASDEMAALDPTTGIWETFDGPGFDAYPAKLLADGDRLLAFGTRWPSGPAVPATNDLLGAELVAGGWVEIPPVDFVTQTYANVADPGTASFSGDDVITWGDPSTDPGSARILLPDHTWVEAPPPPLGPNNAHPTPVVLGDGRILALAEDQSAAIWEPTLGSWTPVDGLPGITGREAMWTGEKVIAWLGGEVWRWTPPPPPAD
jgi:hypothetical protein